jgi:hypothetical protein
MTAMARTRVLPKATVVGALSALQRPSQSRALGCAGAKSSARCRLAGLDPKATFSFTE